MSDRVFLDTNVLVYAYDGDAGPKQERAQSILAAAGGSGRYAISSQVLQEFYVTVTRKLERPVSPADAAQAVAALTKLPVVLLDAGSVLAAIQRSQARQVSLWDALIVQAAVEGGCARVLTEDLQHGQLIDGLQIENPFGTA